MTAKVDARSAGVGAMEAAWAVSEPLMGGTAAMRAAGEKHLPKWPNESPEAYKARKETATLFPAFRRTVSVMVGKPFSKELTLGDDVPAQIKDWAQDIDREGVSLHVFAAEMLGEALPHGMAGILVEAPKPVLTAGRVVTQADQKAAGVRPYFVRVMHRQILGWRTTSVDGVRRLTQLRLAEDATVDDGLYGEKTVARVRVLTPGAWEVWEKAETKGPAGEDQWTMVDSGLTGLTYIPFAPLYGWRLGFMRGQSPLLDLGHLNIKHWQSQSDQDTILHTARVPILAIIGANENTSLTIGGSSAVNIPVGGDIKWVEHGGASIDAGQKSLEALEDQMIQAGAELLVKKPGQRSATESANDAEANKSDLQRITEGFEDSLDQALQMMADYANLGSGGKVSLYKDFGAATLSDASAQLLVGMAQAGQISDETLIEEMKRRGVLSPDITAADEAERIEAQGPALGTMTDEEEEPEQPPQKTGVAE